MPHTKSFTLLSLLAMLSLGCHGAKPLESATSSVAATETTKRMVGEWGVDSEVALIIELDGERVVVSTPENDTWRMDVLDAKIVDDAIHFIQKNYLHDGEPHPFNGVACNSVAKLIDDDTLELGMTTVHTPAYESELFARIK
ncbi:hypothetical protein N9N28_01610 [Rubripirellula amarantea]|nr:hypothetical protein [Rubripirellula amarantea]